MYACARSKSAAWASLLGAAGDREQRTPGPGVVAYLAERPAARAADAGLPLAGRPPELGPSSSEALPSCLVSAPVSAALVDALAVVRARAPCSPGAVPGRGARGAVPATPGVRAGAAPGGERASQRVTRRGCSRSPHCTDGGVRHPGGEGVPGASMRTWVLTWLRSLRGCAAAWHSGSCTCSTTCNSHTSSNNHRAAAAACLRASCGRYAGRTATRRVGSTHVSFPVREQVRGWPRRGGALIGSQARRYNRRYSSPLAPFPFSLFLKPAPPRHRRRHGALAVQQQPLQQQPVQQQQPQPLAPPQQEQKPPRQPRAVRAARRKLPSRFGSALAAHALPLPRLRKLTKRFAAADARAHRRRRRSATPPPKAVHVGGLTRNVTAEHVKEIFGASLCAALLPAHATPGR